MIEYTYEKLLRLFEIGYFVDETCFYFSSDPNQYEHFLGYLPEYDTPFWVGYCDIENGTAFTTAEEMFTAPIFDGKSLKDRWDEVVLINIGGLCIEDWGKMALRSRGFERYEELRSVLLSTEL